MSTWLIVLLVIIGIIVLLFILSRSFRGAIMDSMGDIIEAMIDVFD
jgi:hypothetical protein